MALATGTRLGPHEIIAPIGAGGMGEVYKAKDTRLDRTVAIKVLPSHLSGDLDRRQRLEREARAVSSLNHHHICTLYDMGEQDGVAFLVMEYVEGEDLADRLKKGPLPFEQALLYATQIADALDKAHRAGVVHRDLKPGNIMLTKSGAKLLDFGLAKLKASDPTQDASVLSALPTEEKPLTEKGSILGTFQYMSPEQLEGKDADARTDIFAFGAVLYEMLTGKRAFTGTSQASLIGAIMNSEPPALSSLQPMSPPALERTIKKCLAKQPDCRWQTALDLHDELDWIAEGNTRNDVPARGPGASGTRERTAWVAAVVLLLAAVLFFAKDFPQTAKDHEVRRLSMTLPEGVQTNYSSPVVSPDGRHVAFMVVTPAGFELWVRSLDSPQGRLLPGTEGASQIPFWSADSRFIAFFSQSQLKKVPVSGGPAQAISDTGVLQGNVDFSGAWSRDEVILFSPTISDVLYTVPASGGAPKPVTTLDTSRGETGHLYPQFLPDGRHFLYVARSTQKGGNGVYVGSLDSDQVERVFSTDSTAVYAHPGSLLFVREGNLLAQPFDLERLRIIGEAAPIATGVSMAGYHGGFSVSDSGVLVYRGRGAGVPHELVWFDRSGRRLGSVGEPGDYYDMDLSPDGKRLAIERLDAPSQDIWQLDLTRNLYSRLTTGPALNFMPRWSPDGERVAFMSVGGDSASAYRMYQVFSNRVGEPELLLSDSPGSLSDWSPDGRYFAFQRAGDVLILPLSREPAPIPFLDSTFAESEGRFSPDGRFFAYVSNETGRSEVHVTTFPEPGIRWRISTEGGEQPRWRPDGKELFYLSLEGQLMAVAVNVKAASGFEAGIPQELFALGPQAAIPSIERNSYAVAADGQRFLILKRIEGARARPFTVILNWPAGLEQ